MSTESQSNSVRYLNSTTYELLEESYEDLTDVLEDVDLLQCSVDGVYRALENREETEREEDYSREEVEGLLETLEDLNYLTAYSADMRKEYNVRDFTVEDSKLLEEEIKNSEWQEFCQPSSYRNPGEVIPGVEDVM